MSTLHLHATLAKLCELHGSKAVLEALRDACHAAADRGELDTDHWTKAGHAIGFAVGDVERAERFSVGLADALTVISGMEVSS